MTAATIARGAAATPTRTVDATKEITRVRHGPNGTRQFEGTAEVHKEVQRLKNGGRLVTGTRTVNGTVTLPDGSTREVSKVVEFQRKVERVAGARIAGAVDGFDGAANVRKLNVTGERKVTGTVTDAGGEVRSIDRKVEFERSVLAASVRTETADGERVRTGVRAVTGTTTRTDAGESPVTRAVNFIEAFLSRTLSTQALSQGSSAECD